eukprot:Skav232379  [mRNA]  locus=scaffold1077:196454:198747:- [translate_table: standard]
MYAGFPCIHLSAVRAGRQNLSGEGSKLFWELLKLIGWVQEIFGVFCRVKWCVENVASMDEEARLQISQELDTIPIKLDPSDSLPFNRPRFAWMSEALYAMEGLDLIPEKEYVRAVVTEGHICDDQWMRPGWKRSHVGQGAIYPTFMKCIRRDRPPPVPAGLNRAGPRTLEMWEEENFKYPPYQFGPQYRVVAGDRERLLDSSERELLLGFGPMHTDTCQSASVQKRSPSRHEDIRCSLCGDSFAISSFAIAAASLCSELMPRMRPGQIISRLGLAPGASAHPSVEVPMTRWLSYGGDRQGQRGPLSLAVASSGRQYGLPFHFIKGENLQSSSAATLQQAGGSSAGFGHHGVACPRSFSRESDRCRVTGLMPRNLPRVLLAGRTQAERRRLRAGIRLRDFSITAATLRRYEVAVARVLPFLEDHEDLTHIDNIVCDYIELQWSRGEPLSYISDALCGLHHFWAELRGRLRNSWRLFKSWRRVETPSRAPPLTALLARAFIAKLVEDNEIAAATLISLGFHALLRTGELLNLTFGDLEFNETCGIVSLSASKSGRRTGTQEGVALRDSLTLQLIATLFSLSNRSQGEKLWPHSPQSFRGHFHRVCRFFRVCDLLFKPYSLRRGGATFLLQLGQPMESILLRGRWKSIGVGRLYLQDALALVPSLRVQPPHMHRIEAYARQTPLTAFRP